MQDLTLACTFFALKEDESIHIINLTSHFLTCLLLLDIQQPECNNCNQAATYLSQFSIIALKRQHFLSQSMYSFDEHYVYEKLHS